MMKNFIFFICLIIIFVYGNNNIPEIQRKFTQWMQNYKKSYHHDEFLIRFNNFKNNLEYIEKHNSDPTKTFKLAMNQFGDLTNEEFKSLYLGFKMPKDSLIGGETFEIKKNLQLPTSFDWRTKGVVTKIKNQGQCGSCWAFSTTGSTEGCHAIKTSQLVSLSEQNLMDCSTSYGNEGCNGGLMTQAMQYIIDNKGVDTEVSYPYTAQDGECKFNKHTVGATLTSFKNIPQGDEDALQQAVYQGPTSVAIDASQSSFQFYSSGVYNEPECSTSQLDHGVLVVGWGIDTKTPFWLVKNSWGTSWGMNGYIEMSRNNDNQCGIATMATIPEC